MKFSPTYQMTFSLMNGNPDSMQVDWDIEAAIASKALIRIVQHSVLVYVKALMFDVSSSLFEAVHIGSLSSVQFHRGFANSTLCRPSNYPSVQGATEATIILLFESTNSSSFHQLCRVESW